jgi:ABC-type Fe3+-citrate transport system substrate-binding protein
VSIKHKFGTAEIKSAPQRIVVVRLSLPIVIDQLVPQLAAAVDGNPTT